MRLLAWSFQNIGPFLDLERTVHFLPGATLIKAPIGTGKSFLFFDGPLFALYKRSQRPMLHRLATAGQIQIVFSHEGQNRLIIRHIKSTKAGNDSVTTKLFRLTAESSTIAALLLERLGNEVVIDGVMIDSIFPETIREPIESTQQKDIDIFLDTILPPREVILSSCVLVQDSDNIFEMTPATRIAVFKELFQLLDIDHIRERLADKKRQLQTRRLVLQEDKGLEQSLQLLIQKIQDKIALLKQQKHPSIDSKIEYYLHQPLLYDLVHLPLEEIHTAGWSTSGYDNAVYTTLLTGIDTQTQQLLFQQGQVEQTKQQITVYEKRLNDLLAQQARCEHTIQTITTQLASLQDQSRQGAQQTITELQELQSVLFERLPHHVATARGLTRHSLADAEQYCLAKIAETKNEKLQQENLQKQQEQLKIQESMLQKNILQYEEQITQLEGNARDADRYHCDKIQGDCPYVMVIKKVSTNALDQQKDYLQQQISEIKQQLPKIREQYELLGQQGVTREASIQQSTAFFSALNRPVVNELFTQGKHNDQQLRELQKIVLDHAQDATRFRELQEEKQRLHLELQQIQSTILSEEETKNTMHAQLASLQTTDSSGTIHQLKAIQTTLQEIHNHIDQATTLGLQVVKRQEEIRVLQDQEGIYKDLVTIFQKELLLVVLQDFLPVLENVINEHLSQVAQFQLRFELPKTMQEQIELNIWIDDTHGARAVKSLSGGQKALLRLCRILSVSALFNQEFLLLDETINSLDNEAIGRVATLLDNYVKKRDMSFYLVTHAPQIQEMDFWRRIVEL